MNRPTASNATDGMPLPDVGMAAMSKVFEEPGSELHMGPRRPQAWLTVLTTWDSS